MKVLHLIESMGHGGAEWLIVEHVRHAGPGVESLVCAVNRGGAALEAAAALGAGTFVLEKAERRWATLQRLRRMLRDEGVDVVNGHNPVGGLYAALASFGARRPIVFRTEHSTHYRGRHSAVYPVLETLSTAVTRRVVCVCQAVLESHVRRMPWAARRFVTVANGISSAPHTRARDSVRQELGIALDERVALTVGSLTPAKAQHLLLEAFVEVARRVPEARLYVAGEGALRPALEAQIRREGLDQKVRLLGARRDTAELMAACDVFVLSSVREGLPVTVLEAMRAGRPVVATRAGGTAEAVDDGVTGRVVPLRDAASLAAAMAEVLGDRDRAALMGRAGHERWARDFTAERMVRETESLYRAALEASPQRVPAGAIGDRRATS
jgi:glycosyltransferase involved in cell wall biosynthesis